MIISLILIGRIALFSQSAPAVDENIPYLMTFGGNALTSWGDDDFCQVFYCIVPPSQTDPVYIRVYDPDTGGELDELKGEFNTIVNFSIYGGNDCWSDTTAQGLNKTGNYKSGYLLASKSFGVDSKYDKKWYTFGPFNPSEGNMLRNLADGYLKSLHRGYRGMMEISTNIF